MKKRMMFLVAAMVAAGLNSFAAEWTYSAFESDGYQPAADAIKGVGAAHGWLTDGKGDNYVEAFSDREYIFEFPAEAEVSALTVISKWCDNGRVNFGIKSLQVKKAGSDSFTALDVPALEYSEVKANGAKAEITGLDAKGIDAIKIEFSRLQNGFIGLAEVEFRGKMKPVVAKAKPVVNRTAEAPRKIEKAPEPKPEVVRPKIALKKGEWCYDPEAHALTDGTWSFAAEAQGDRLEVGKVKGWPKKVTALDLSGEIKNVYGDKLTIVKLDPCFGHRGPDTDWQGRGGPAAGFVGALKLPGEGLEEIGELAFTGCTNGAGKVVFPKSLKSIRGMAFCRSKDFEFEKCPFGENVKTLSGALFEECHLPAAMQFPHIEVCEGGVFKNSDIKAVSFGRNLKKIHGGWGAGIFAWCSELRIVKFDPEAKTEVSASFLFHECRKLVEADLRSFVSVECPQGTPFEGCENLRILRFGKLPAIPKLFFRGLTGLCELHFEGAAPAFDGEAFDGVWRDYILHRPKAGLTTSTFVHVDPADFAAVASWAKLTEGGELKTSGSVWNKAIGGQDAALRPLLLWKRPTVSFTEIVDADEAKGGYGYFTVSRGEDDPIETSIPVTFKIGGTAKPGQTYCSIWNDAIIPCGEKSGRIKIRPLNDPKTTKDATVTLTLNKSESYAIAKGEAQMLVKNGAKYGGHLYADAGKWNLLAHMGNSGVKGAPQHNTVAAAKYVLDRGYVFENDIQISPNGVLYLDHDNRGKDYPTDWPDTFDGTLKVVPKGAIYKVDAKCGMKGLTNLVNAVKADKTNERALLAFNSWDEPFCRYIHQELPGAQFWLPVMVWRNDYTKPFDLEEHARRIVNQCKAWGAEGISIMWVEDVCTDEFFEIINEAGIIIDVWSIDDMRTVKEAINRGARYITTNRPVPITGELPWAAAPVE